MYVGLCPYDFKAANVLSREQHLWCINLNSGDVFGAKKWKQYADVEEQETPVKTKKKFEERIYSVSDDGSDSDDDVIYPFKKGSTIGVLANLDKGSLHFYHDGDDLGQAFLSPQLKREYVKEHNLYPFVQMHSPCQI